MSVHYDPCFNPVARLAWEMTWEREHAANWRSMAKTWGGSPLYVPVTPIEPVSIPKNESVRALMALQRQIDIELEARK